MGESENTILISIPRDEQLLLADRTNLSIVRILSYQKYVNLFETAEVIVLINFCTIWAHTHEEASQSFCIERIIHMFPSHCCCIWQTKTSNCLDFRLNFHNCRPNRRSIRIKSKQSNSCRKPFDRPHSIWSTNIALTNHLINLNPFGETMRWRCIFFCDRSIIPSYF